KKVRVEVETHPEENQRHGEKHRLRIVEQDLEPLTRRLHALCRPCIGCVGCGHTDASTASCPARAEPSKRCGSPHVDGSRHMEHTRVLHSVRVPARMSARSADMDSPFSAPGNPRPLL